jgi:hypothetical protein
MPRVTGIAPFFLVADVVRAAEYYRDKLGFTIRGYFFEEPPVFAMVGRDDQIVMLSLMKAGLGGAGPTATTRMTRSTRTSGSMTSMRSTRSSSAAPPIWSGRRSCGSTA